MINYTFCPLDKDILQVIYQGNLSKNEIIVLLGVSDLMLSYPESRETRERPVSIGYLKEKCGLNMCRANISSTLNKLIKKGILSVVKEKTFTSPRIIKLTVSNSITVSELLTPSENNNCKQTTNCYQSTNAHVSEVLTGSYQSTNRGVSEVLTMKDTIKETIKKQTTEEPCLPVVCPLNEKIEEEEAKKDTLKEASIIEVISLPPAPEYLNSDCYEMGVKILQGRGQKGKKIPEIIEKINSIIKGKNGSIDNKEGYYISLCKSMKFESQPTVKDSKPSVSWIAKNQEKITEDFNSLGEERDLLKVFIKELPEEELERYTHRALEGWPCKGIKMLTGYRNNCIKQYAEEEGLWQKWISQRKLRV